MAPDGLSRDELEALGARRRPSLRGAALGVLLGVAAAAGPMVWLYGFTVDDALISARIAHHLALGLGYRYNPGGPPVDAVTPLGYAHLLAPFARSGVLAAFEQARWIGALAWCLGAGWLGWQISARGQRPSRFAPLLVLALSAQPAAWAVSGMETGLVLLLASLALARSPLALLPMGVCAAWRPELVPWSVTLAAGASVARSRSAPRALGAAAAVLAPALCVAVLRQVVFGFPTPLAALAKPSDLGHGCAYVFTGVLPPTLLHGGALPLTAMAWLALAPAAWRAIDAHARSILLATAVHFLALVLAGGDWMVLHRLAVPVVPGLALAAAAIAESSSLRATSVRLCVAGAVAVLVLLVVGPVARGVAAHRRALIEAARPHLTSGRAVAALDVGWVGAATPGTVVDLAGVTDPTVALLPGGHTSKQIPAGLLARRGVDRIVLLLAPGAEATAPIRANRFARAVEQRVAQDAEAEGFHVRASLPLGGTAQQYLVLAR